MSFNCTTDITLNNLSTMNKQALRQYIRQQKKAYTPNELKQLSIPIVKKLLCHPRILSAKTILLYASLADEVNTHELIKQLLAQGKEILLPVVIGEQDMKICPYLCTTHIKKGAFGIIEPQTPAFTAYHKIDVALIPGMAFDLEGNRLGRGKGYYDRFLLKTISVYKIGICFPFQLVNHVPTDENDICMNEIVYQ